MRKQLLSKRGCRCQFERRQKKPGMPPTPAAFSAPPGKRAFPHNSLPMRLAIFSLGEQSLSFLEETILSILIDNSIDHHGVCALAIGFWWEPKDFSRLLGFPFLGNPSVWSTTNVAITFLIMKETWNVSCKLSTIFPQSNPIDYQWHSILGNKRGISWHFIYSSSNLTTQPNVYRTPLLTLHWTQYFLAYLFRNLIKNA